MRNRKGKTRTDSGTANGEQKNKAADKPANEQRIKSQIASGKNSKKKEKLADSAKNSDAHTKSVDDLLHEQKVDAEQGLTAAEVSARTDKFGPNEIPEKGRTSVFKLFIKQFSDLLIVILVLAAGISWYIGEMADVYIILAVILFNAVMGFTQEYKAEKAIESIKQMVQQEAVVIRDGKRKTVKATALVPGDIIVLEEGQNVPADGRLIRAKDLRVDEASLTGESEPVSKNTETFEKDMPLGDRRNMVWKASHLVKGAGLAVVTATGKQTQIGMIAHSLSEMKKTRSNFRKKTDRLARIMAFISIGSAATVFLIGYFYRSFEFQEILLVTIATVVSSIPEGLPVVISIVLSIGARRMAKKNAIIREFTATEELGSVTTILSDKTGTITGGVLTVRKVMSADKREYDVSGQGYEFTGDIKENGNKVELWEEHKNLLKILTIAAYCNQSVIETPGGEAASLSTHNGRTGGEAEDENNRSRAHQESGIESERPGADNADKPSEANPEEQGGVKTSGDPTELALRTLAAKTGIRRMEPFNDIKILDDLPFDTEHKFRATLIEYASQKREVLVMGAPEKIFELSTRVYKAGKHVEMSGDDREFIDEKHDEWASQALRIIGLACAEAAPDQDTVDVSDVKDLRWTGIVGIIDPPRTEVKDAIAACRKAGIRVMMVTGDHKITAAAIAKEVGIVQESENDDKYPVAVSEKDISGYDNSRFEGMVANVSVFARVSPQTKVRIAESLQKKGELIAMTGDGVNDALALKKADVGIAMGIRGTDVARDAAKIVLSDDNFASIVSAVREGRIIFKNLKNTSYFLITTNFAAVITFITAMLLGLPIPVTAVQILWVNMVTDGVMDIALATEPSRGGIMDQKPIRKNESILKWEIIPNLVIMSVIMVVFTILTFRYYLPQGLEKARTGAFLMISLTQVFNVFNLRDIRHSVFRLGLFSNKWINLAFIASFLMQVLVIKIPYLRSLFGFDEMGFGEIFAITGIAGAVLLAGELYKLVFRKVNRRK